MNMIQSVSMCVYIFNVFIGVYIYIYHMLMYVCISPIERGYRRHVLVLAATDYVYGCNRPNVLLQQTIPVSVITIPVSVIQYVAYTA